MLRSLSVLLLVIASALAANAATLSVNSDKLTYLVGETVTLTVRGDDEGPSAYGINGGLEYSGAFVDNATRSQTTLFDQTGNWVTGPLDQGDDGINAYSEAFDQVSCCNARTADNLPGTLSIVTL